MYLKLKKCSFRNCTASDIRHHPLSEGVELWHCYRSFSHNNRLLSRSLGSPFRRRGFIGLYWWRMMEKLIQSAHCPAQRGSLWWFVSCSRMTWTLHHWGERRRWGKMESSSTPKREREACSKVYFIVLSGTDNKEYNRILDYHLIHLLCVRMMGSTFIVTTLCRSRTSVKLPMTLHVCWHAGSGGPLCGWDRRWGGRLVLQSKSSVVTSNVKLVLFWRRSEYADWNLPLTKRIFSSNKVYWGDNC